MKQSTAVRPKATQQQYRAVCGGGCGVKLGRHVAEHQVEGVKTLFHVEVMLNCLNEHLMEGRTPRRIIH